MRRDEKLKSKSFITEIIDFNPKRTIKKGVTAPFVEMAALPENSRDIQRFKKRKFKGGGSRFQNNDTLFARITPCLENGKTAKVNILSPNTVAHGSTEFIVMAAKKPETDKDFIYYLARLPEFREYAQARMEGTSGRQRVSWQSLAEFELYLPNPEKRKKIGNLLKSFDDKIQLNQQINQTLEEMAQAIFKSWFVDFEPTKAKIDILESGGSKEDANLAAMEVISGKTLEEMEQFKAKNPDEYKELYKTAQHFPSAMQDSELGEIPEGWKFSSIGDEYKIAMGQSPKGETYNESENGMLFYQGRAEFGWRFPTPRLYTTDPKRIANLDDTLMTVRAPVGDLNIALESCCIGRGLAALRHNSNCASFTYYQVKHLNVYLNNFNSEGTVFGSINQKDLKNIPVIKPCNELIQTFSITASSIDKLIKDKHLEILILRNLRDELLPKLLSGELSVENIEDNAA